MSGGGRPIKVVLASASPRRRELLSRIGLTFEVEKSEGEERPRASLPDEIVRELSAQKAEEVFRKREKEEGPLLVIGADTLVFLDGRPLGKPKDQEDACSMLSRLQGRKHQVWTGVTALWKGDGREGCGETGRLSFAECTEVEFYPMAEAEISAYVRTGEPADKAGAYAIQGRCAAYIKGIAGDYNNVVGLPVSRLYQELRERKLPLPFADAVPEGDDGAPEGRRA